MPGEGTAVELARERPRGLAGAYLQQSLEALSSAGDPDSLYPRWAREKPPVETAGAVATLEAFRRRTTYARTAIMFAALAAEAYVNEFLATTLDGADFRAVDRLPTVEKYVVGCRLALGENLFERGREPIQTIASLFKLRDKLVHPKAGYGPPRSPLDTADGPGAVFTPADAGHFIFHVGAAAVDLVGRGHPGELFDIPADFIVHGRNTLFEYANRASGSLPAFDAPRQDPLMGQLMGLPRERSD